MTCVKQCTLFAVSALLAVSCSRSPQSYIEAGNRLYAAGKLEDASLTYRKALQKDPTLGEALYRLALVEIKQKKVPEAYASLAAAVRALPKDQQVRVEFADLCLGIYASAPNRAKGFYDQANQMVAELKVLNPQSFDGYRLQGQLAVIDHKIPEAIALFRKADATRPMQPEVILSLVRVLVKDGQLAEGERLALAMIGRQKNYEPIYDELYLIYAGSGRAEDAENILKTKVRNNPSDITADLELANHYVNVKKPAEMAATLKRLVDSPREFPGAPLRIGDFFAQKANYGEALRYYDIGLERADTKEKLVYLKRKLLVQVAQGHHEEAEKLIDSLLRANPKDDDTLSKRAALNLESGNPDRLPAALRDLQDLALRNPREFNYRYNLGRVLYATGNLANAEKEMLAALQLRPDYPVARLYLAEINIRQGQFASAMQYAEELLAANPAEPRTRLLRAICLKGQKDYKGARAELSRLIREQPRFADAELQLGLLDVAEKQYGEANRIFTKYYQPGQQDLRPLEGLVESDVARNQVDQALNLLTEEVKRSPRSIAVRVAMAELHRRVGEADAALEQYRLLASENPKSPDFELAIGQIQESKGDLNAALAAYTQAKVLEPASPAPSGYLAQALAAAGRNDEAIADYRESLKLAPGNAALMNNLAYALADSGKNLDEALALAQKALQSLPDNAGVEDTVGWVYLKRGDADSAVQVFTNVVRKNPGISKYYVHLGMALLQKGDKKNARLNLQNALANQPSKAEESEIRELLKRAA